MTATPASFRNRCWNAPVAKLDTADSDSSAGSVPTENASIVKAPMVKLPYEST